MGLYLMLLLSGCVVSLKIEKQATYTENSLITCRFFPLSVLNSIYSTLLLSVEQLVLNVANRVAESEIKYLTQTFPKFLTPNPTP